MPGKIQLAVKIWAVHMDVRITNHNCELFVPPFLLSLFGSLSLLLLFALASGLFQRKAGLVTAIQVLPPRLMTNVVEDTVEVSQMISR